MLLQCKLINLLQVLSYTMLDDIPCITPFVLPIFVVIWFPRGLYILGTGMSLTKDNFLFHHTNHSLLKQHLIRILNRNPIS